MSRYHITRTIRVPAVTVYNYVTRGYDTIRPAFDALVKIELDVDRVAEAMGRKAALSRGRRSVDAGGALVVTLASEPPAHAPLAAEHRYDPNR